MKMEDLYVNVFWIKYNPHPYTLFHWHYVFRYFLPFTHRSSQMVSSIHNFELKFSSVIFDKILNFYGEMWLSSQAER
jgi:hypothetical protein